MRVRRNRGADAGLGRRIRDSSRTKSRGSNRGGRPCPQYRASLEKGAPIHAATRIGRKKSACSNRRRQALRFASRSASPPRRLTRSPAERIIGLSAPWPVDAHAASWLSVSIYDDWNRIKDFSVEHRSQELDVFRMCPKQRRCRASGFSEEQVLLRPVRLIPDLLRQ